MLRAWNWMIDNFSGVIALYGLVVVLTIFLGPKLGVPEIVSVGAIPVSFFVLLLYIGIRTAWRSMKE